ncbi:MAG: hypothetical protein STSR0008_23780 [Ignavibacterium sp.]
MSKFNKWKDKIIYYIVDDFPKDKELLNMANNNSNVGAGEYIGLESFIKKKVQKKRLKL